MELNFEMELNNRTVKVWAEVSPYCPGISGRKPCQMICDESGPNIESVEIDGKPAELTKAVEAEIWEHYEGKVCDE